MTLSSYKFHSRSNRVRGRGGGAGDCQGKFLAVQCMESSHKSRNAFLILVSLCSGSLGGIKATKRVQLKCRANDATISATLRPDKTAWHSRSLRKVAGHRLTKGAESFGQCWKAQILQTPSAEAAMRDRTPSFARHCEPRTLCHNEQSGQRLNAR